jgi:hypothetical protein
VNRETEIAYLNRRIEEEREKAESAADPASYRAHTDFACEYERKLQALIAAQLPPQLLNGHVVS